MLGYNISCLTSYFPKEHCNKFEFPILFIWKWPENNFKSVGEGERKKKEGKQQPQKRERKDILKHFIFNPKTIVGKAW